VVHPSHEKGLRMERGNNAMKSTFGEFITDDPKQKALFDKEYDDFLLSEFIIQKMEEEKTFSAVTASSCSCITFIS
jgi:hypothetical protein